MVKMTALAKIDGDQLERALALKGLESAELAVAFRVSYKGAEVECNNAADLLEFLQTLRPASASASS